MDSLGVRNTQSTHKTAAVTNSFLFVSIWFRFLHERIDLPAVQGCLEFFLIPIDFRACQKDYPVVYHWADRDDRSTVLPCFPDFNCRSKRGLGNKGDDKIRPPTHVDMFEKDFSGSISGIRD